MTDMYLYEQRVTLTAAVHRAAIDPALVEEVYFGNVLSANVGGWSVKLSSCVTCTFP